MLGRNSMMSHNAPQISPVGATDDAQTSIGYNARTGEVWVDAPWGTELTSINLESAAGIFTGARQSLGGSLDSSTDSSLFKATFGASFGSFSFGSVAQPGLARQFIADDLTVTGSLVGGGDLGDVDLIYVPVPEPASMLLLGVGVASLILATRSRRTV